MGRNRQNNMRDQKEEITNWPGLGGVLKRTVCWPSRDWQCCIKCFLCPLGEQMRGFHEPEPVIYKSRKYATNK
jgi:hypothetical protein